MSKEIVEVTHGKHRTYHIIRDTRTFSSPCYYVKSTDGEVFGSFKRLDAAVRCARTKAAQW